MSGKYAHELTELTELTDTDTMVIEDADAPSVLKRVSVRTLKSLFGSSGAVAPEEYIEDPGVSNPDWEVEGIPGGWRVRITSVAPNALWYCVQKYNVETEEYNDVHSFTASLQSQGSQKILYKDFEADDIMVPSFALFRLITIATDYTKSTASDTQTAWSLRSVAPDWTPSAPTLLTEGGYPEIIQTTAQKFLIKIKIQAADGERHYVDGYRVRTRQWEDDIENWGAWSIIPGIKSTVSNRPLIFYYEIQGDHFSRRSNVQIAAAAVAMAPSGHVGAWSTAQEVDPSTDATAPDVPSLTITKLALVFQVAFSAPARGEGDCPDWDHWVVQYRLNGGNATYVPSTVDGVVDTKAFYLMASTQTQAAAGDTFQFRAKAVDYAGNESAYCAWTSVLTAEQIAAAGLADNAVTADKVGEIALFGWQFAGAFSATDHNTVAWEAAAITLTDGTVYAINAGNTGDISALTYIYLDINISETAFQTTTTPATAVGAGKILIAVAKNVASGKKAEYQVFGGSGGRLALLTADNIAANTVTANEIAANTITASEIAATTITASEISATAGLSGAQLHITSGVVFDADAVIQGLLTTSGGIATAASGHRVLIGEYGIGGAPAVKIKSTTGSDTVSLQGVEFFASMIGIAHIGDPDNVMEIPGDPDFMNLIWGYYIKAAKDGGLALPSVTPYVAAPDQGHIWWDVDNHKLKVYDETGDTTYTFSPD